MFAAHWHTLDSGGVDWQISGKLKQSSTGIIQDTKDMMNKIDVVKAWLTMS
jgi:hypothetical protein